MKLRKMPFLILAATGFLLMNNPEAHGDAVLKTFKKGEEGQKAWAMLEFDQRFIWLGASQAADSRFSVYFLANAGELAGSSYEVDASGQIRVEISQVSQNPSIMRADLFFDKEMPLVLIRRNTLILMAFNDERFFESKFLEDAAEVPNAPGRLVSVLPDRQENELITSMEFTGTYEWVGLIRPSSRAVALITRGATLFTSKREYNFDDTYLYRLKLFGEYQKSPVIKTVMFFRNNAQYYIARKPKAIVVKSPYLPQNEIKSVELASPALVNASVSTQEEIIPVVTPEQSPEVLNDIKEEKFLANPVRDIQNQQFAAVLPPVRNKPTEPAVTPDENEIPWNSIVSFKFSATPVKDALRTIARGSGLNLVIGEEVDGMVNMNLESVTVKQALDKIVLTHDCEYFIDSGIIMVKKVNTAYASGRISKVYRLKYADAENVATVVQQVVSKDSLVKVFHPEFLYYNEAGKNRMTKNPVAIQGIRRSSMLVVTDRPERIREVDMIIEELDKPPVQIMIESKLVEMAPLETKEMGINWDKTITALMQWQELTLEGKTKDYSVLNQNLNEGGEWRLGHLSASQFGAVLDFLQEKTDSKLVSNPSLMAMDNEESSISVGTTVPVPRIQRGMGGQGDMVTFEYKEVNIQLNVTPHVGEDREIIMYVNPVIEEITGWVEYQEHRAPITDKRTVNSVVSVRSGETVVIGGLIKTQKMKTRSKVWLLGSLPLLGKLFQHESFEDKQTDLMIFITPKLIEAG